MLPYFIDYFPVKSVALPAAYILDIRDREIIDLLKIHGIRIEVLAEKTDLSVERFEISRLKGSSRLNQGHYLNTVEGRFVTESKSFPAGTCVIKMNQPLANVCAYLLEPQSADGLLAWNFLDRYLVPQWGMGYYPCPVYKLMNNTAMNTVTYCN